MTPGQWRVIVLLIVLFALEMVIHPAVKGWVAGTINGFNTALNSASGGK